MDWKPIATPPPTGVPLVVKLYVNGALRYAIAEYLGTTLVNPVGEYEHHFVNIGSLSCGCCDKFDDGSGVFAWATIEG